jgi:hypothetical protein
MFELYRVRPGVSDRGAGDEIRKISSTHPISPTLKQVYQ